MRLGINEISKKKSITPLKKVILILHFNKMNNELQTPTSSFYFWRIFIVCLWSNQKKVAITIKKIHILLSFNKRFQIKHVYLSIFLKL